MGSTSPSKFTTAPERDLAAGASGFGDGTSATVRLRARCPRHRRAGRRGPSPWTKLRTTRLRRDDPYARLPSPATPLPLPFAANPDCPALRFLGHARIRYVPAARENRPGRGAGGLRNVLRVRHRRATRGSAYEQKRNRCRSGKSRDLSRCTPARWDCAQPFRYALGAAGAPSNHYRTFWCSSD